MTSPPKSTVTVMIVEDHPLMVESLRRIIGGMEGFRLAGVATTIEDARLIAGSTRPDVITLDLRLGAGTSTGIRLLREIRSISPNSRVLIYSAFASEADVSALAEMGIEGYVTKDERPSVVSAAIRAVAGGSTFYSSAISRIIRSTRTSLQRGLDEEEIEILRLVARGLTNGEIARRRSMSPATVARRLTTIFQILAVNDRAEAVARAYDLGYLDDA